MGPTTFDWPVSSVVKSCCSPLDWPVRANGNVSGQGEESGQLPNEGLQQTRSAFTSIAAALAAEPWC